MKEQPDAKSHITLTREDGKIFQVNEYVNGDTLVIRRGRVIKIISPKESKIPFSPCI